MAKDSYSAGNLEMQIQAVGTNATASLSSVNQQLKTMKNLVSGTSKALSFGKLLGKLYFIRNYTKQIGRSIANLVQNAIDYTETLNLWQVAMRNNRQEAEKFVGTMNKAYGISEQTLMNYQATFKNMLSALGGISDTTSYALSEYLTQMALDYASLYNTSIERAMTVFQSVLSGQVRPIRSISGYDITETTIFQLYQQLGGEKTMRQLSQTEKRLLRIYAVFQQMENSGTIGDLNKTLGNSANQLRILSESTKELGTWIGIIMEQWIKPILPYLNATIITLKNIIQAIAVATGYKPFEGAIENSTELNEELDKITGKLLSFDRFESLNSSADKNILGIDTALLEGLSKYESILSGVTNEATELAKQWTAWWVDSETGTLTENAQRVLDILKSISIILGIIIGYKIISKVASLTTNVLGLTSSFNGLKDAFVLITMGREIGKTFTYMDAQALGIGKSAFSLASIFKSLTSPLGTTIILVGLLYATNEDFRDSVNNLLKSLMPLVNVLLGLVVDILKPLVGITTDFLDLLGPVATFLVNNLTISLNQTMLALVPIMYVLETIVKLIQTGLEGLRALVTFDWKGFGERTKNIWSNWNANDFAKSSWGNYKSSIGNLFKGYKTGGLVEDGIFTMNKKEMAGTFSDGSTVVANNQQIIDGIKQGVYSAVVSAMNQTGNRGGVGNVYLDRRKVGIATAQSSHKEMVRTSLVRANS